MAECDWAIAQNIAEDCDNPQTRGLEADGIIINRKDIDFASCVKDPTNPNIVKTLALKTGTKGYSVAQSGATPFTGTQTAFAAGTYRNKFNKDVQFVVLDHSADAAHNIIDQLANGSFVLVLKNNYNGSDGKSKYEIVGYESGTRQTEGTRDPYGDADGGWIVKLQEVAPTSAIFLFDTDESTTDSAVASLLTPAP